MVWVTAGDIFEGELGSWRFLTTWLIVSRNAFSLAFIYIRVR